VDRLINDGLHEYLDELQVNMNAIGNNLLLDFFARRQQIMAASLGDS
jgi:uncharacterized alpha-E superfamily protein